MDALTSMLNSVLPPKSRAIESLKPVHHPGVLGLSADSCMLRLAGLSGALAISLSAYGAHALREADNLDERRLRAFETGNRYHLLHSLAMLSASRARFPWLTASLMAGGMLIFSGTCYHYSITGQDWARRYTPIGGIMYILAWLSFIL